MPQVLVVDAVAGDAEEGKPYGEAVDEDEESLEGDDGGDEVREEFLCEYRVLFDELGEVVEARCCGGILVW